MGKGLGLNQAHVTHGHTHIYWGLRPQKIRRFLLVRGIRCHKSAICWVSGQTSEFNPPSQKPPTWIESRLPSLVEYAFTMPIFSACLGARDYQLLYAPHPWRDLPVVTDHHVGHGRGCAEPAARRCHVDESLPPQVNSAKEECNHCKIMYHHVYLSHVTSKGIHDRGVKHRGWVPIWIIQCGTPLSCMTLC